MTARARPSRLPDEARDRLLAALCLPDSNHGEGNGCIGTLPLTRLDDADSDPVEVFLAPSEVTLQQQGGECFAHADGWVFGNLPIDESEGLALGAESAYGRLFERLDRARTPHLWRVWHYLPEINAIDAGSGLERYRLFNQGRAAAFDHAGQAPSASAPAACALGSPDGTKGRLFYLAAATPTQRIENPRQVSAWNYPVRYGPKSPLFARAALASGARHDWLFVSGTASIVGHETRHHDDVVKQTEETIANLETVLEQANARRDAPARRFAWDETGLLRIYLRHPAHLVPVRECIDRWLDDRVEQVYLQADICREDLLVEIEATLRLPRDGTAAIDTVWPAL
ncbi:hypothetical protein SR882_06000 [Guyparkeria halophila]|uniref:Chorismatase FkbO/Hyg5-like N-terminal domain-containing protein n=1 Tax=Guyparkeria halophila TaxID=47960 RepID=A0ABZ0YTL5_9GAMM|nr:hypothetical protein [Guyparkeria halophila]WQH15323.1 hypothetical protein SR882_06000 [Guyparkeria halophila]